MTTLLSLLPLLLVLGLLASGRASALVAGLAGLAATLAASATLVLQSEGPAAVALLFRREVPAGLWLSWHVIAIIVTGVFFHRANLARGGALGAGTLEPSPRRLFAVCFLLAPFAESVTGFGVGYIIALAALRRLGIGGMPALLLGLYSQSLVPWGALAIGTTVGATLAGLTPGQLGLSSAVLQVPIHALYLLLYWRFAREAGVAVPALQKLDDALWTAALLALIWLANRFSDVEIAAAAPTALLLAVRFWRDERPDAARLRSTLRTAAPYVALTLALCATRLVTPLRDLLKPLWAMRPFDNQPAFAPFYAPGFWLLAIGLAVVLLARATAGEGRPGSGQRRLARLCRDPRLRGDGGILCRLRHGNFDRRGAAGGGGTRRRAGRADVRRGRRLPDRQRCGGQRHADADGDGARPRPRPRPGLDRRDPEQRHRHLTMLSPIRVSMGAAILALSTSDAVLYRRAWPLALPRC
jgi:lactate permease